MNDFEYKDMGFWSALWTYSKYSDIIMKISCYTAAIETQRFTLSFFSGMGIQTQVENIRNCSKQLAICTTELAMELDSLKKIIKSIKEHEERAEVLLNNYNEMSFVLSEIAPPVTITAEDWKKLEKEFKYYSQNSEYHKQLYDLIKLMVERTEKNNTSIEFDRAFYDEFKRIYHKYISSREGNSYIYSNVEYFDGNVKKKPIEINTDGKSGGISGGIKAEGASTIIERAVKYDDTSTVATIKISGGDISGGINVGVDKIKDIIDKLNEGKISKKEIEKLLEPLNISIGGSAYALEFSYLTIKELSDGRCLYVENTVRIGEIAGEADFGTGGVEAKVGYALVTIDTDMGYIDQDGKYGVKGGLKIGQEAGVTASNDEVEVSFGPGSIGLVFDDGFNYYEWQ